MTKTCTKCSKIKDVSMFGKNGLNRDGTQKYRPDCKECKGASEKEYWSAPENRDRKRKSVRENRAADPDKYRERAKAWRLVNLDKDREYKKSYYNKNKDKISEYHKRYYRENIDKYADRRTKYYEENRQWFSEYQRQWYLDNKERITKKSRARYTLNKDRYARYSAQYRRNNSDVVRRNEQRRRARERGLFWDNVTDELLAARDGLVCGWCSCELPEDLSGAHRDHIMPLALGGPHAHWNITLSCSTCNLRKNAKDPLEFITLEGLRPSHHVLRYLDMLRLSRSEVPEKMPLG